MITPKTEGQKPPETPGQDVSLSRLMLPQLDFVGGNHLPLTHSRGQEETIIREGHDQVPPVDINYSNGEIKFQSMQKQDAENLIEFCRNLSPEQTAQFQSLKDLSPEEIEQVHKALRNLDPGDLDELNKQFKDMKPEQFNEVENALRNLTPEQQKELAELIDRLRPEGVNDVVKSIKEIQAAIEDMQNPKRMADRLDSSGKIDEQAALAMTLAKMLGKGDELTASINKELEAKGSKYHVELKYSTHKILDSYFPDPRSSSTVHDTNFELHRREKTIDSRCIDRSYERPPYIDQFYDRINHYDKH
jgi:hypothetical protein